MRRRRYGVGVIVGVVAVACAPFWYQLSVGLVLGYVCSLLHLRLLSYRVDRILKQDRVGVLAYLGPLLGLAVLACPLYAAFAFPEHISWIGVFIGMMARKVMLYVQAFRGGSVDDI
jgi:hypothetical protein